MRQSLPCWILLIVLGLLMPVHAQSAPALMPTDCPFPPLDPTVRCATLSVPENRADPEGAQVQLMVAILPAFSPNPLPDPVIYLEGGPGFSAVFRLDLWIQHPLRMNRDLVLLDQRGTGFSLPSLNCPEVETGDYGVFLTPLNNCRYRLAVEQGVDILQYNSAASAADLNDLRMALGAPQVNLYGISYGTRLALTTMRDYPNTVRAAVLDSILPPEADLIADRIYTRLQAFDALFAACATDPACNSRYPNLQNTFYELVTRYNAAPYRFSQAGLYLPLDGELDGNDIVDALFNGLYRTDALPYLPAGIARLARATTERDIANSYRVVRGLVTARSFDPAYIPPPRIDETELVQAYIAQYGDVSYAEGVNASVNCSEEILFSDANAAAAADGELVPPALRDYLSLDIQRVMSWCAVWEIGTQDRRETERVYTDVPALLLSGAYDPITSVSWMMSAREGLPNSTAAIFTYGGHGVSYADDCGVSLVVTFINAPHLPPDTSCAGARRIQFAALD